MNEATPKVLTGPQIKALSERSDWRGAVQLGFHLTLVLLAGWWVAAAAPPHLSWTLLPAMLLLGIAQAALFAPIHETMHLTAFRSRRANAVAGWLSSCPSMLNWHFYTAFHLAHHRHTQDPARDPELEVLPPSTLDAYLLRICAAPYWRARARVLRACWRGDVSAMPYITERSAPKVIRSVRLMTLFMGGCATLSILLVGPWAPLVFWLGPQLLGQPFLRLYLLTEHTLCTMDANGLTNTRTTLTNRLVRAVMWNMSFHTEHHLYPSIPFHRLPDAHVAIRDRLGVVQDGYASWHAGFVRTLT